MKTSGHEWTLSGGEKCALCGDKDWMADKYCSGNQLVEADRNAWLKEMREQNQSEAGQQENNDG